MVSTKKLFTVSTNCIASIAFILITGSNTCSAEPEKGPLGEVELSTTYTGSANFKGNGNDLNGEVEIFSASAAISIMDFNITYKNDSYSWNKLQGLPFGNRKDDPWENLHSISAGYNHADMFNQRWGYLAGVNIYSEFEKEMSGSYSGIGYGGVIYKMAEQNLVLRVGVGVGYNEVETTGIPMIGIDWNSEAAEGFSVSVGLPETRVAYKFNQQNTLYTGLTCEDGIFRLADDSKVSQEGYFEQESYGGMVGYIFQPSEQCSITVGATYYFDRQYNIYDKNGENKKEYDLDNAAGGFITASFTF